MTTETINFLTMLATWLSALSPLMIGALVYWMGNRRQEFDARGRLLSESMEQLIAAKIPYMQYMIWSDKMRSAGLADHEKQLMQAALGERWRLHAIIGKIHTIIQTDPKNKYETELSNRLSAVLRAMSNGWPSAKVNPLIDSACEQVFRCLQMQRVRDFTALKMMLRIARLITGIFLSCFGLRKRPRGRGR